MVHIIMGPEGSGKTKRLIDAIHQALKDETGSMVCIEKAIRCALTSITVCV